MGFYGNISNTTKVQFSFDRIFSSRSAMDEAVNNGTDAVFAGRFVLVSYDKDIYPFQAYYQNHNKIYSNLTDAQREENEIDLTQLVRGTIIRVPLNYNCDKLNGIVTDINDIALDISNLNKFYGLVEEYEVTDANNRTHTYQRLRIYTVVNNGTADEPRYTREEVLEEITARHTTYYFITENNTLELVSEANTDNPYLINYLIDTRQFGAGRGYDGTVWQKMYADGKPYFAMVAELNSIVPTLAITADAPTVIPRAPHFDVDTSNVYYKLHIQSNPGLWIKPARYDENITVGTDIWNKTTGQSSKESKNYPSDVSCHYPRRQNDGSMKPEDNARPAAMYFNKAGFDAKYITYAGDVAAEDAEHQLKNI